MIEPSDAPDLLLALRLLERRRRVDGRGPLSPGLVRLMALARALSASNRQEPPLLGDPPRSADDDAHGDVLLDLGEVADRLRVGKRTVERYVANGSLRTTRLGRTVRIHATDLRSFIDSHRKD